jgi:phosphatidylinositol alpha-1,6-mannosyltransferase
VSTDGLEPVHVTGLFPELIGVGGVQEAGRLTAIAANAIARRRGWSANFAALNDPGGTQSFALAGQTLSLQGFARAKLKFIRAAIASSRAAHNCPAHIIVAGHPNLAPIAVWMQKMSPHACAIVMAHGVEVWQPLPVVRRATIRASHMVTAPSSDTVQKLIQFQKVSADRTRLLPWPLNPDFLRQTEFLKPACPAGFPLGETKIVLTIGRAASVEQYKGTDDLILAVSHLQSAEPDLHLVVVGGGDDLERLRALAQSEGVAERVHFLGRLPHAELAACYANADIFAMPSAGEGFGLVFLEAMAYGKPLIAAEVGGAVDVVHDGENGLLVPPRELPALIAALSRLLKDASLRRRLGERGAAIARQKYQFAGFQAKLEHLFEECL